jgi:hypothetical protein
LPAGARFTQKYFINTILPDIVHEKEQIFQRIHRSDSFAHTDNSMCHNGRNVTDELEVLRLDRVPHPPHSSDLSPCNFWLFGMLKQNIKDPMFPTIEEILDAIRHVWREVTLE